jgi:hypothetical protein
LEVNMTEKNDSDVNIESPVSDGPRGNRLANLEKLYHVPVFALRELLRSRVPGRSYGELRQGELVAEADRQSAIGEADVEDLYENYRYGRRLSFYLYLLPAGLAEPTIGELQVALDELAAKDRPGLDEEVAAGEDYEGEASLDQIALLDEEILDGIREIRFRYYVGHRFLNVDEQPDQVLQTRYGFLWLDLSLGYLVILSRDERILPLLIRALANCLQALPVPVHFPKELVDKHFSIEKVRRVSHYDPGTGVRQSLSGSDLWQTFEDEILAREQRYVRPSSLFDEEVAEGVVSGLGVTSSKGKIYLTKTLSTSLLRTWGVRRLPDLVRDVKDLRIDQPESFRSTEAINRMRLPAAGKAAITEIAEALLETSREELTSASLSLSAWAIYEALAGKYFNPYLRLPCGECDEIAELCPHCESRALDIEGRVVTCKDCGAVISDGESVVLPGMDDRVVLRCMDGHLTSAPLEEAFSIAPNHWLQKRVARIFAEVGQSWSERQDYFHIEGTTLYRLRRGEVDREQLPQMVQNYINNFWEAVKGQVHTGSGDLIVEPSLEDQPEHRPREQPREGGGPLTGYTNFDLRIRGSGKKGYMVEAEVPDGGSVPPQPLLLPRDKVFLSRLVGALRQTTDESNMRALGEALFCALFPTRIAKLWSSAKGSLEDGTGMRVRLRIDPPELTVVPWELAFEEEYIGLRLRFPIVRYLDLPEPPKPLTIRPPLRVLVAVSQPEDLAALDITREVASIRQALEPLAERVELEVVDHARRDELLARLRRGYHVLHFIGHGMFDGNGGYLALEDSERGSDLMSASLLGEMVADSSLRLVVLNACETSTAGPESAFGGVAHQLVKAGMPAVVAMQLSIADRTAVAFSREFYGALGDGWPVDTAVQEGRRSIMAALGNHWNENVDWAIPTLYMRAPDGVILGV